VTRPLPSILPFRPSSFLLIGEELAMARARQHDAHKDNKKESQRKAFRLLLAFDNAIAKRLFCWRCHRLLFRW
jgi:hypothetical protein